MVEGEIPQTVAQPVQATGYQSYGLWQCDACTRKWDARTPRPQRCPDCRKVTTIHKVGEPIQAAQPLANPAIGLPQVTGFNLPSPIDEEGDGGERRGPGRPPKEPTDGYDATSEAEMQFERMITNIIGNKRLAMVTRELFFNGPTDNARWLNRALLLSRLQPHQRRLAITRWYGHEPQYYNIDVNEALDDKDTEFGGSMSDYDPLMRTGKKTPDSLEVMQRMMAEQEAQQIKEQMLELQKLKMQQMIAKAKQGIDITSPAAQFVQPDNPNALVKALQFDEEGNPMMGADGKPLTIDIPKSEYSSHMMAAMMLRKNSHGSVSEIERERQRREDEDKRRRDDLEREERRRQDEVRQKLESDKAALQQQQQVLMMEMQNKQQSMMMDYMKNLMDLQKNQHTLSDGERLKMEAKAEDERKRREEENKKYYEDREMQRREAEARIEAMRQAQLAHDKEVMAEIRESRDAVTKMQMQQLVGMVENQREALKNSSLVNQMDQMKQTIALAQSMGVGGMKTPEQAKQDLALQIQQRMAGQLDEGMKEMRVGGREFMEFMRRDNALRGKRQPAVSEDSRGKFFSAIQEKMASPAGPVDAPPPPQQPLSAPPLFAQAPAAPGPVSPQFPSLKSPPPRPEFIPPVTAAKAHSEALRQSARQDANAALAAQGIAPVAQTPLDALPEPRSNPSLIVNPPIGTKHRKEGENGIARSTATKSVVTNEPAHVMDPTEQIALANQRSQGTVQPMKMHPPREPDEQLQRKRPTVPGMDF
jgi:hypothetical protein